MKTFLSLALSTLFLMDICLAGPSGHLKSDSLTTYWLSEIVVTAPKNVRHSALPVREINARDIQKLNVSNVAQALSLVPALYLSTSSKNETTFRLRGIDQRQISVFLDGIPITLPFNGIVDLAQFVTDDIAKIRVAAGVSSVLYGTNNIGGSLNIITQEPPTGTVAKLRLESNPAGYFYNALSFGGTKGRLMYFTALHFDKSSDFLLPKNSSVMRNEDGGRRNHSSYTKMNGFAKLRYVLNKNHQIGLLLNWIDNTFDIPPNALSKRPRFWRFPFWQRSLFSFNTNHAFKKMLLRSVWYWDRYKNKLKAYDDASYATQTKRYAFTSLYDDYSLGFNLYPEFYVFPFGKTAGIFSFKKDVHRQGPSARQLAEYAMQTLSLGLEQNLRFTSRLSGQLAGDVNYLNPLKAQNYAVRDALTLLNGQIALRYFLNRYWDLHLAGARKSRFPTLKELYSEYLGRSIANPHLKPEYGLNSEIGLDFHYTPFKWKADIFYNRLRDLIAPAAIITAQGKHVNQMQNIAKALFYGIELESRFKLQRLEWYAHYTFLQARNQTAGRTSSHLEYRPQQQLFLMATYSPNAHWIFEADWQGFAGQYYQNPDNLQWQKLNDYALLNLKIHFLWSNKIQFYLRGKNVFDRFYYSEWGVPMPGRQIILGFQTQL